MSMNTCARSAAGALCAAATMLWKGDARFAARFEIMQRDMDRIAAGPSDWNRVHGVEIAWAHHERRTA